jgi:CBS domain-containing protein
MSVGRIATRAVATAGQAESVLDVARRMDETNVGCVVVVEEGKPVGIVTDRDIVTRAVSKELDPAGTPVATVMTRDVRTVDESTPIEQAVATMGDSGARRLVVTGGEGRLAGILSIDDVMDLLVEEAHGIGRVLREAAPSFDVTA